MAILDSVLFLDDYFADKKIDESLAWRDIRTHILDNRKPSRDTDLDSICPRCEKGTPMICRDCYESLLPSHIASTWAYKTPTQGELK